jgi:oligoendopeptidase F
MSANNTNYTQTTWSLDDLFSSSDQDNLDRAFAQIDVSTAEFEKIRPKLNQEISTEDFLSIIHQSEDILRQAHRLSAFAELRFTEDTQNQTSQSLMARMEQFMAEIQNRMLFFSLWWKELSEEAAERLMTASGDFRYWLEEMRHFKPFTLSEPEEKIINIKDVTGTNALNMLYESITNRYTFLLEVDGEQKELTRGELMVHVRLHDPAQREKAYQELYRVYGQDGPVLGQIYQSLVRDWRNENQNLRGFKKPISPRNLANDIPDEVVNTLLNVSQRNTGLFQRFFRLKAKVLNVKRLRRYDIYAPIAQSEKMYEFGQAADMVLDSFRQFDPEIAILAQRVLDESHLDSEVRKGKMGGAFCASTLPEFTPWVLLNYQGRPDDVATMAHELGHAIHAMLAADHSIFTFHSSLPLAETASTFGEMMLVDRLMEEESDEKVRRDLLFRQVDDSYATIMRQTYFAIFERQAHHMISEGASVDELSSAYMQNLKDQFGDAVELSNEFRWEWVSIPHIYRVPFYVYAYAFGQLLVLSLYQQYRAEGEAFKPRYKKILSTGGSESPAKILANAGIDIYQDSFWQGGFDVIEGLIEKLEQIRD